MATFGDKLRQGRAESGLTQLELAKMADVSLRSIAAYENGEKTPRDRTALKLASAIGVSVKYLTDDGCSDPTEDIEKDGYIAKAHERYDSKTARDIRRIMDDSRALFAGGELTQEQKDDYFAALMEAYVLCKDEAAKRRGKKK
ncbi:MAG: helix-turn-helix transcriptional regulator [Firmicutes bacterium]|nr:helix-turn-helix transcriptional regulator [Candidatus Colimorpha enterica]